MTVIKSPQEVAIMRQAGKIVAKTLQRLTEEIRPGIKTSHLDSVAASELKRYGAKASFKGYRGFPAYLCVSVNDEIVHGIPGERELNSGDIVSLDFGAIVNGFHGDGAITVGVGRISSKAQELVAVTEAALMVGIKEARNGAHLGDVSAAIQNYVETSGFSVVREYSGHGIGRDLHEDPLVPNFGSPGEGPVLRKGMTLAVEPMVTAGDWRTRVTENRWTVLTIDGSLAAHFEHTIAISEDEAEILTLL
ncbi:MAG: type I methionyl aminopeptidase [Dehalococcoidia bacterium]|jgi:methionyl aminopeptidase|nr:type I methionyl aminopeptidase [Dehalococcoidia bacterium]